MSRRKDMPIPSPSQAKRGAKLSLSNAHRHLKAAEALRDARLYGPGVSHLVLTVEELAKAWVLTMLSLGLPLPAELLRGVLYRHDARQAFTMVEVLAGGIRLVADRSAKKVQRRHKVSDYPPELRGEWVHEMEKEVKALAKRRASKDPIIALMRWTSTANERKNEGLYVDFGGVRWKQPGRVSKKQFDFDYAIAAGIFKARRHVISGILRSGMQVSVAERTLYEKTSASLKGATIEKALGWMVAALLGPSPILTSEGA